MKKLIVILILSLLPAMALADVPLGGYSSLGQASGWQPAVNTTAQNSQALGQTYATPQVNSNGQINYTPLEPLTNTSAFGYGGNTPLSQYLGQGYTILVTVGGLLAVVFLVVGGVRYMLSEAFTDKDKAKKQMWSAVWGLVIILGSFLILYSINPNLLTFKLDLPSISQAGNNFSPATSGLPGGTTNPNLTSTQTNALLDYYKSSPTLCAVTTCAKEINDTLVTDLLSADTWQMTDRTKDFYNKCEQSGFTPELVVNMPNGLISSSQFLTICAKY